MGLGKGLDMRIEAEGCDPGNSQVSGLSSGGGGRAALL